MLNISLTPEARTFIEEQLSRGKYRSTDEILLAGLGLLASQEASEQERFAELRGDIEVGIGEADQGEVVDGAKLFNHLQQKLQQHESSAEANWLQDITGSFADDLNL